MSSIHAIISDSIVYKLFLFIYLIYFRLLTRFHRNAALVQYHPIQKKKKKKNKRSNQSMCQNISNLAAIFCFSPGKLFAIKIMSYLSFIILIRMKCPRIGIFFEVESFYQSNTIDHNYNIVVKDSEMGRKIENLQL